MEKKGWKIMAIVLIIVTCIAIITSAFLLYTLIIVIASTGDYIEVALDRAVDCQLKCIEDGYCTNYNVEYIYTEEEDYTGTVCYLYDREGELIKEYREEISYIDLWV